MLEPSPQAVYLRDYRPPAFLIDSVALDVDIRAAETIVTARLAMRRNPHADTPDAPLALDGEELELLEVQLDRRALAPTEFRASPECLNIAETPNAFELTTVVRIYPQKNSQLMGLYRAKDGYFTQCEAEGFRRITYFLDRPDVMSRYTTTIHASKSQLPILLSNGNLAANGDDGDDRHWARWRDPFPKPAYLFAMVAAELDCLEDSLQTASGRAVSLRLYVEPGKLGQADFAMAALKSAIRWDEESFGLELDLDQYMIVAVSDFNMGAMENKGLNIFNTKYVLAHPDTATDNDFMMLDRVVAHEYFHNWTGNRVTCRDWFQLSLKEGLTVYRDQRYGEDRYSRAVQRIQEVRGLRASQFPEDAGPMAHPVQPERYIEINNFYTATVYNKGAEVVRMIETLIGRERFRAGMDLYFSRHDGHAVRIEEFVQAMQDASGVDLEQFQRWYRQAGTPVVQASGAYDAGHQRFTLTLSQSCPPTPGQAEKQPYHIPITVGLIDSDGASMPLHTEDGRGADSTTCVLSLVESAQDFVFEQVASTPIPSLLRHFSAPIVLEYDYTEAELTHLLSYDSDPFNRWEAGQRLALRILLQALSDYRESGSCRFPESYSRALGAVLADAARDPAFTAEALALPGPSYIAEQLNEVDPEAIDAVRTALRRHLAENLRHELLAAYDRFRIDGDYQADAHSAGCRALQNSCLGLLMTLEDPDIVAMCVKQFDEARNMTEAIAALGALVDSDCPERVAALENFYAKWRDEALVIDKWFAVQARARHPDTLEQVITLHSHEGFDMRNPNRVRALIGSFCHGNHLCFNAADGRGYAFAAEQILALDPINPQIAARLARAFDRWRRFDAPRRAHAEKSLQAIKNTEGLSNDTYEVVSNALAIN